MNFANPARLPQTLQLNDDILYYIFTLSTYRHHWGEPNYPLRGYYHIPLSVIRRCSQVCVQWRYLLLHAKRIWGSCIDIEVLGRHEEWIEEVLRRTGDTLLTVRCGEDHQIYPGDDFVAKLLDRLWPRIKELKIAHLQTYSVPIKRILEQPTETMESFTVYNDTTGRTPDGLENHTISLFSGYSPNLVSIDLAEGMCNPGELVWQSLSFFTNNIRHMNMDNENFITPLQLLSACARLPRLETLSVTIGYEDDPQTVVTTDAQEIISMRYLSSIAIASPAFDIYLTFLSRIYAAPGCTIIMEHSVDGELHSERYMLAMKQVFTRFSTSMFTAPGQEIDGIDEAKVELGSTMWFEAYGENMRLIVHIADQLLAQEYYPGIIDTFLAIKMPRADIDLLLDMTWYKSARRGNIMAEEELPIVESSIRRFLGSMPWVTLLHISYSDLSLITSGKLHTPNCFPHLEHLYLTNSDGIDFAVLLPFVLSRKALVTVGLSTLACPAVDYLAGVGRHRLPPELEFIWNDTSHFSAARGYWVSPPSP